LQTDENINYLSRKWNFLEDSSTISDCVPHRQKRDSRTVRTPKLAPKRTLSKSKIAEMNINEIEITDMKIIEIGIVERLSMICISGLNFGDHSFRSLLDKVRNIFPKLR
jgi:hypothetical protein